MLRHLFGLFAVLTLLAACGGDGGSAPDEGPVETFCDRQPDHPQCRNAGEGEGEGEGGEGEGEGTEGEGEGE